MDPSIVLSSNCCLIIHEGAGGGCFSLGKSGRTIPYTTYFAKLKKKVFTNKTMVYALPFSQDIEIFFVKGAFTNYLNMFLAFFDLIPTLM